jgi:AcrR family transcriptional regulator
MRVSSVERKEQLINATIELMRRDGIERLNLRAIADEAGASLATVHYCFDGKDDLLRHAVEHWVRRMVDIPDVTDETAQQGLALVADRIADAFWTALEENPDDVLAQIELVTWAVRESPKQALARTIYQRYETALGDIFADALARSAQASTWEPSDLARAFIAILDGSILQYLAEPTSPSHRVMFRRLLSLLLTAAVPDSAPVMRPSSVSD